jgi:hypothetical protein
MRSRLVHIIYLTAIGIAMAGWICTIAWVALGCVDSKDSLLGANQIQSCFWGGSLGCEGPIGFERRDVGADGAADYRSN